MAQDEIKSRILGWCSQASEIAVVQDRDAEGADVALLLRLSHPEGARLGVLKLSDEDRVDLIHTLMFPPGSVTLTAGAQSLSPPASLAEAIERVVDSRFGSLAGSARQTSDGQEVTITSSIYVDGLTKHAFIAGIAELTRVRRLIDHLHTADLVEVSPTFPQPAAPEPAPEPAPVPRAAGAVTGVVEPATSVPGPALTSPGPSTPMPTPVPTTSQAERWAPRPAAEPVPVPAPVAQPAPEPVAEAAAPVAPAPEPFTASHRVPPSGMDAWSVPDPTQRAVARIDGGVPIQVTEVAGAWAHVLCSNGWTGWVDHRILVPASR